MPRGSLQFVTVVFPDHTHYFCKRIGKENPSLGITVCQTSPMIPNGDPWNRFFYPILALTHYPLTGYPLSSSNHNTFKTKVNNSDQFISFLYEQSLYHCIIELFAHCTGGFFNIHIWAWFGYFIF